ncbi:hypothetical protein SLA2020_013570 [Shorea laevis]
MSGHDKPWCKVFAQKYLRFDNFLNCKPKSSSSATRRRILKCRDVWQLGIRWQVGTGLNIKLSQDIWASDRKLLNFAQHEVLLDLLDMSVVDIIDNFGRWHLATIREFLLDQVLSQIFAILLPSIGQITDSMFWHASPNGNFIIKSTFELIQKQCLPTNQNWEGWTGIWRLCCSERIKLFVWLLKKGQVLTNFVCFE